MQLAKGAEAVISKEDDFVIKERASKSYRLPELDEKLRKRRTALEARLLREARRIGVNTPRVLDESRFSLKMEFIEGEKVKDILDRKNFPAICDKIGKSIALLHTYDIIHGDLTTSNFIWKKDELYVIDFGLGFISKRPEDKAVDLHLLREALESTHFGIAESAWKSVIDAYKRDYEGSDKVIKALSKVEKRGRYVQRKAKS